MKEASHQASCDWSFGQFSVASSLTGCRWPVGSAFDPLSDSGFAPRCCSSLPRWRPLRSTDCSMHLTCFRSESLNQNGAALSSYLKLSRRICAMECWASCCWTSAEETTSWLSDCCSCCSWPPTFVPAITSAAMKSKCCPRWTNRRFFSIRHLPLSILHLQLQSADWVGQQLLVWKLRKNVTSCICWSHHPENQPRRRCCSLWADPPHPDHSQRVGPSWLGALPWAAAPFQALPHLFLFVFLRVTQPSSFCCCPKKLKQNDKLDWHDNLLNLPHLNCVGAKIHESDTLCCTSFTGL